MKLLDLAFLSQPLSFHSHLYGTLLSYHLWFRKQDLSFRHKLFLTRRQVFPSHKPSLNLSLLPLSLIEYLHSFLSDRYNLGHSQNVDPLRVGQFLYLQICRLQAVAVQASLVQHIQCHPPHFLDHTLQSLEEKFFTSPLALLVQVIPVQIHIGRMVLYVTPEWLTLE